MPARRPLRPFRENLTAYVERNGGFMALCTAEECGLRTGKWGTERIERIVAFCTADAQHTWEGWVLRGRTVCGLAAWRLVGAGMAVQHGCGMGRGGGAHIGTVRHWWHGVGAAWVAWAAWAAWAQVAELKIVCKKRVQARV
jgi:hypothetical protein